MRSKNTSSVLVKCKKAKRRNPYRKVSLGREFLGEVVKGIGLGADRVTIPVDLVEEMS